MILYKFHSYLEYLESSADIEEDAPRLREIERSLMNSELKIKGKSYTAGSEVLFDYFSLNDGWVNWRETLICPETKMINRARAAAHFFTDQCVPSEDDLIFISEATSPLYYFLKQRYPNLIGSEYFGKKYNSGEMLGNIRHEDLTDLSFRDNSLDYVLSFDCLEHIPEPTKALKSVYKKIKPGGEFCWSVPFEYRSEKNIKRAELDNDGNIVYLLEPEIHGDPMCEDGIISYTTFGWEMLDICREIGFREAYALLYWSADYGYLGATQSIFFAVK